MNLSRSCFIALVLLPALAMTGCLNVNHAFSPQHTTLAADRMELPTSVEPGYACLYVEARINGAGPFRLLVDTGAFGLTVTPSSAAAAGLKPLRNVTMPVKGAGEVIVKCEVTTVERVDIGGLVVEHLAAVILEKTDAENLSRFTHLDGILGLSALEDVVLEMDFPRHQVSVVKPASAHYPAESAVAYTGHEPTVQLDVAGKSLPAMIDSGFAGIMSFPLDAVPLRYPQMRAEGGVAIGTVEDSSEAGQLAGEVRLGPVSWVKPPIRKGTNLVGVEAFKTWKLVVDQHAHKIYFLGENLRREWPETSLLAPIGYSASFEGSRLRVITIKKNSVAERAGLQIGDVIISIEGRAAVEYVTAHGPADLTRARTRKFVVLRDGKELEITVTIGQAEWSK